MSSATTTTSAAAGAPAHAFLHANEEKLMLNQYWYSAPTIQAMVADIQQFANRCCFLSTPSLFFSLTDADTQRNSRLFDYDDAWASHPCFVKYDFKRVDLIPAELHHTFDFVVIDPPFITEDVWQLYADACRVLLVEGDDEIELSADEVRGLTASERQRYGLPAPGHPLPADVHSVRVRVPRGKILLSTIPENEPLLHRLLGVSICRFRPSIPNLIYQYSLYVNYPSVRLMKWNAEIDPDEHAEEERTKCPSPSHSSKLAFTSRKATTMVGFGSDQMVHEEEAKQEQQQQQQPQPPREEEKSVA